MNIEDLFDAESALRAAAREYGGAVNDKTRRDLRAAARKFSQLADDFDATAARETTPP